MEKWKLHNTLDERFNKIKNLYRAAVVIADMDAIHDFRVEFKKIEAIQALSNFAFPDESVYALPQWLKNINTLLGRIRNYQILQQQMIRRFYNNVNIVSAIVRIQDEVIVLKGQLKKQHSKNIDKIKLRVVKNKMPGSIPYYEVQNFLQSQAYGIVQIIGDPIKDIGRLHKIRKRLKIISNIVKLISLQQTGISELFEKKIKQTDLILHQMGELEDSLVVESLLTDKLIHQMSKPLRNELVRWKIEIVQFQHWGTKKTYDFLIDHAAFII